MPIAEKPELEFRSLSDLFAQLRDVQLGDKNVILYRGHADKNHTLRPSIFRRKEHRRMERNILRELIAIQPNEFREDRAAFEQLVRMQHYGLPTRLLDLTYNPLVALYFACAKDHNQDGELIRIELSKSKLRYFDSDTVSCVANLSNLTGGERDAIRALRSSEALRSSAAGTRLLHFIRGEKPYFEPNIRLEDLKGVHAVRPKQTNQRILAQQGAFLIFGLRSTLETENDYGLRIFRTNIPARVKRKLLSELDIININASSLFPEIESAAKYIMSKIPFDSESFEQGD